MLSRFLHSNINRLISLDIKAISILNLSGVNLHYDDGEPLLTVAVKNNDHKAVNVLLERGANPNRWDLHGSTPLIHAAKSNNVEMIILLCTHGAKINLTDVNKRSALHYAAYLGHEDVVHILLSGGAKTNKLDIDYRSVMDYARCFLKGKPVKEIVEKLEQHSSENPEEEHIGKPTRLHSDPDYICWDYFTRNGYGYFLKEHAFLIRLIPFLIIIGFIFFSSDTASENLILGMMLFAVFSSLYVVSKFASTYYHAHNDTEPVDYNQSDLEEGLANSETSARSLSQLLKLSSNSVFDEFSKTKPLKGVYKLIYPLIYIILLFTPLLMLVMLSFLLWLMGLYADGSFDDLSILVIIMVLLSNYPIQIIIAMIYRLCAYLLGRRIVSRQHAMAESIANIFDKKVDDSNSQFTLYLRSFELEGDYKVGVFNFSELLVFTLAKTANVLAAGMNNNRMGPVNLKFDDGEWKKNVKHLIERSLNIIIIPADSEGVLWEIALIKKLKLLHKTVFVCPPTNNNILNRTRWEKMRRNKLLREYEIPPFCDSGYLFTLHKNGSIRGASPLGMDIIPLPLPIRHSFKSVANTNNSSEYEDFDTSDFQGDTSGVNQNNTNTQYQNSTFGSTTAQQNALLSVPIISTVDFQSLLSNVNASDGGDGGDGGGFDGGGGC